MWTELYVHVGDRRIQLSVERLDDTERERTAAVMAWLSLGTMRSGTSSEVAAWNDMVAETVSQHVKFVVPGEAVPNLLGSDWWTEAVGTAFIHFIRQNELAPSINRHLESLGALGGAGLES